MLNWSSGTFNATSSLVVEGNGMANLLTSGTKVSGRERMVNSGEVIWTGGDDPGAQQQRGLFGQRPVNLGLWQVQGDLDLFPWFGTGFERFINGGTLRKASGSGVTTVGVTLLNEFGNVEVRQSGTLALR